MTEKEHFVKVLVCGQAAVGKTSIVRRVVHDIFENSYKQTIAVDFGVKALELDAFNVIKIQFWDVQGQELTNPLTNIYYRNAVGCFVVYDLSRPETLEESIPWKQDIDGKVLLPDGTRLPAILVGNKCDLVIDQDIENQKESIDEFCDEHGFDDYVVTSAKTGQNVMESVEKLAKLIIERLNINLDPNVESENNQYESINLQSDDEDSTCAC
ncbi:hypothetical protein PCE1_001210 [Barthelona sp. PCE]